MTETVALATDVHNVHASTKFCNRFGGSTVTVVNTGSTPVDLAANPALVIKRMKDKLIEEAQSRLQNMDGGSIEQMGQIIDMIKDLSEAEKSCLEAEYYDSVIDAMENGQRYGYDGQGGNAGGRQGYRESYIMDNNGDGEGRMGYRNQYGNFPANPKNRRRMRRSGYSEESIDNLRQMMEDADPERKRQLKRDLEDLMSEM